MNRNLQRQLNKQHIQQKGNYMMNNITEKNIYKMINTVKQNKHIYEKMLYQEGKMKEEKFNDGFEEAIRLG